MKIVTNCSSKKKPVSFKTSQKKQTSESVATSFLKIMDTTSDGSILDILFSEPESMLNNMSLLAEELEKIGQELAEKPLPENFLRYKKHIRILLKGIGKNFEIQEITSRIGFTRTKLFRIAENIDQILGDLAQKILNEEKNRIEILKLTNQLQGLVLDIIA